MSICKSVNNAKPKCQNPWAHAWFSIVEESFIVIDLMVVVAIISIYFVILNIAIDAFVAAP